MQEPEMPSDEPKRLAALRNLDILDTSAEERFDRLTRVAGQMLDAPIALVSLVDANRQWFKSKQGLDACETPRNISFCGHAILGSDLFYIDNALEDARFSDNPLVTGPPNIRSYVGAPLKDTSGKGLGTLCVIDSKPTHYTAAQLQSLRDLADCVENEMAQLDLMSAVNNLSKKESVLQGTLSSLAQYTEVLEKLHSLTSSAELSFEKKIEALLEMGRSTFDVPVAMVSRIEGESYTVQYSSAPVDAPEPGTMFSLGDTYCCHTLHADAPTGFHHAGESHIASHPCYQQFKLESYIGVPILVDGERYGTLNFSGPTAKENPFSPEDYSLLQLFGQWVSVEIERMNHTQSLIEAKKVAESHNRAKSEFLNVMSHELRTPLTVVLGYLPILKKEDSLPPAPMIAKMATDMESAGQHLMAMINDLLDISKIEADKLVLHNKTLSMKQLSSMVVKNVSGLAAEKGLELKLDIQADPLVGDEIRIKQVLYNLLSNAIKFTDQGSITVTTSAIDNGITCQVIDTGQGIPGEDVGKVFDKFHQVDGTSTRKKGGTGLGLAITKKLVELHDGWIDVHSQVGQGSTFTFTLMNQQAIANG